MRKSSRACCRNRPLLNRYPHGGAQSAHRTLAERDIAAMGTRDVARNRQPKPGAAFVLVASIVEPEERLEHFLAHGGGNTRAVVVDGRGGIAGGGGGRDWKH